MRQCAQNGPGKQLAVGVARGLPPRGTSVQGHPHGGVGAGSMACVQRHTSAQISCKVTTCCRTACVHKMCHASALSNPSFSLTPSVWPEWVSWSAWQTALLASLAFGFLKWCGGCFSGCTVQFGSYVRFPACGRRDLGGTLAGRRLLPLVAGLCRRRSGVPRGQARRPFPVFETGMRAATRLCRLKPVVASETLVIQGESTQ